MGIFMFFTFFVSDLIVLLACGYENKKYTQYRDGMLMNVHIPAEAVDHEEVQAICRRAQKQNKVFQRVNHLLNLLICSICIFKMELGVILWVFWIMEYIVGIGLVINGPHKDMYQLKIKNQWINEKTKYLVHIDTTVAAEAGKRVLNWKWHLLIIGAVLAEGIFLWRRDNWFVKESVGVSLYGISLGISLLFLIFHLWIVENRNVVYSQNSEVNLAVNRLVKGRWSLGIAGASFFNLLAWSYLIWQMATNEWVGNRQYIWYMVIQFLGSVFFLVPVLGIQRKKQEILEADSEGIYVDDDEFWKDGSYNNPNDRRILVPGRVNSASYTFNMGRPAGRRIYYGILLFTVIALGWAVSAMLPLVNLNITFERRGELIRFAGGGYKCEFAVDEILDMELIDELPDDRFSKINGGATQEYRVGHFKGKETGKTMMFLYKEHKPILKIILEEQTIFANSKEAGEAERWYEDLNTVANRNVCCKISGEAG